MCYRMESSWEWTLVCLAGNYSVGDVRLNEYVKVFSRVINYLNNTELVAVFSDPVKFHTMFNSK